MDSILKFLQSRSFRIGMALLVSGLAIVLAFQNVSFSELGQLLSTASPSFSLLALVSVGVNTLAKAIRWQVLFGPQRKLVPFRITLQSLLSGQMLNTLLPIRLGDLDRALVIGPLGPGRAFVIGTVVLEKILDLLMYAFLFIILLLMIPLPGWLGRSAYSLAATGILVTIAAFILAFYNRQVEKLLTTAMRYFPQRIRTYATSRLASAISSLGVLQNRQDLMRLAFWTAIVWLTAILNNHLVLLALNISLPISASLLILLGLQVGLSIPSVPGRIGIFEYICILALRPFGINQVPALGYGILLHAIVLLPSTLVGLTCYWWLGWKDHRRFTPSQEHDL